MFDLYIVVTPILGLITFLTLINLKLTLKEPNFDDLKYYMPKTDCQLKKQERKESQGKQSPSKKSFIKTLKYLMKNFTFLDLILVRRARNKVPLILAFHIQLGLTYFFGFSFYFSAVGILSNAIFLFVKLIAEYINLYRIGQKMSQQNTEKFEAKNKNKLQILMTTLSLLLNMGLMWLFYKNYKNNFIIQTGIDFGIIFAIDTFVVKPIIFAMISLPLSFSDHVNYFINCENEIVQILYQQRTLKTSKKHKKQIKNPQKVFISTSHTENTLEIQPYVHFDPYESVLQQIKPSKKVQIQKVTNVRKRPSKQYNGQNLSLSLFQSHLPIKQNNFNRNFSNFKKQQENLKTSPKIIENTDEKKNLSFVKKKKRVYTQNKDFIEQQKGNQLRGIEQKGQNLDNSITTPRSKKFLKDIKFSYSKKKNIEANHQNQTNLNYSQSKDRNQKLQRSQQHNDQNKSNHSYGSNFYGSTGKPDLLKIYEDKFAQDLGQIDVNSPQRRRKPVQIKLDEAYPSNNQSSKNKKFSLDRTKNILQQSNISHFPEFLQKTHAKQSIEKKRRSMQQIGELNMSRKSDLYSKYSNESRMSKSFKRTIRSKDPIVRENDENRIPEFVIEDFTY